MDPKVSVVIPTYNRRDMLLRLLKSVYASSYKNLEVIIVSDNCTDDTGKQLGKRHPKALHIRNKSNKGVCVSRNRGIRAASGDLIMVIDDDNVIDRHAIRYLVDSFRNDSVYLAGPVMYYFSEPKKIWWAGTQRNMYTSKTTFPHNNELPSQKDWSTLDFPNCWMFRKNISSGLPLFDETMYMHYEESDFAYRIKHLHPDADFVVVKSSKIYHDIKLDDPEDIRRRWADKKRVFYTARNRVIFHKRYNTVVQKIIFLTSGLWLFMAYYLHYIYSLELGAKSNNLAACSMYVKGTASGVFNGSESKVKVKDGL